MKLAPFAFLLAFFGFFLSNEYVLFNSELVFIVSFLIFFFLAVEVLGSTIAETLDDREKQIKDEYFSVLVARLRTLAKSYSYVYELTNLHQNAKNLRDFQIKYFKFLEAFLKQAISARKRQNALIDLLITYKYITVKRQRLSEATISRICSKTVEKLKKKKIGIRKLLLKNNLNKKKASFNFKFPFPSLKVTHQERKKKGLFKESIQQIKDQQEVAPKKPKKKK